MRILSLDYVLWRLKAGRDGLVPKDDVGSTQLSILVEKNLGLKYPVEILMVN